VIRLSLYTRPGCHLCEEMKEVVRRIAEDVPLQLNEIDISGNTHLEQRYGTEIPVLLVEGSKVAKYRIAEGELRRALQARMT
jgi:hypothetical protein